MLENAYDEEKWTPIIHANGEHKNGEYKLAYLGRVFPVNGKCDGNADETGKDCRKIKIYIYIHMAEGKNGDRKAVARQDTAGIISNLTD